MIMNTIEYMAAVKARLGIDSDYAFSKALGITRQAVSRYSKGHGQFDDDIARRVAAILDIHPGLVMLDMRRERAKTPEDRSIWQEIYKGFRTLLPHAELGMRVALA
jgi:hypothetical protein